MFWRRICDRWNGRGIQKRVVASCRKEGNEASERVAHVHRLHSVTEHEDIWLGMYLRRGLLAASMNSTKSMAIERRRSATRILHGSVMERFDRWCEAIHTFLSSKIERESIGISVQSAKTEVIPGPVAERLCACDAC